MESEVFELVINGVHDTSTTTRANIIELLKPRCRATVKDLESALHRGGLVVERSSKPEGLSALQADLIRAGAQVAIVRAPGLSSAPAGDTSTFPAFYHKYCKGLIGCLERMDPKQLEELTKDFLQARARRSQIFVIGNGGSAANASHWGNDFSKPRFKDPKSLFRVISLTDNLSWISATANDEGYDLIFVNQLKTLMQPNDLVLAISSSGNSPNVIKAVEFAKAGGATTYAIVGFDGGKLMQIADKPLYIPSKKGQYGFMEDITLVIGHIISIYLYEHDQELFE
ncbi:MAG: SIS domain-containing protein [Oligoflexia bacterium]|nr:SIS domain-containing protein [Oligoflexia bacterium]